MYHFEKMSSASAWAWLQILKGELPLEPAGGLSSFIPFHCPPLEKSCGHPCMCRL